ncbi:MAG TPA: hypothetical protein P5346_03260 [Spirochaetota bacterium]|nr:hypothetical protein [Spirochaetota bacterium]HSA13737.1 hypothetical protein [Spirochaetota bacterium]
MPTIIIALMCSPIFAESVFVKDGSIIEGKIIRESERDILLKRSDGHETSIPRSGVMRVVYHDQYKKPVELHKSDGKKIKGYIVDENRDDYIMRTALNSPDEITVKKNEVDAIVNKTKDKKESTETPLKSYNHSVALAVFSASFPVWSGSFNDGFQPIDGLGITFVLFKSASVVMIAVGFTCYGGDIFSGTGGKIFSMGLYNLMAVWPAVTLADMIFSGVIVHKNNKARGALIANDDETTVDFSVYPRMNCLLDRSIDPHGKYVSIDSGLNIAVGFRW